METKKTIMYETPEAASIKTVTGWVASNGRFWGNDERMARYDGSTHRQCEKNQAHPIHKTSSYCRTCSEEGAQARWDALPRKPWDSETPLVLFGTDIYLFDAEALRDHMLDHELAPSDMRLVFCTPNHASQLDPEYFADDLPEDGELSGELYEALDTFNAVIRKQPPLSWSEGKIAAVLPDDFL